jgi:type I restriction enzyme S subunit
MEIKKLKDLCIGKGEYGIAAPAEPFSESKYRYLRITDISDNGTLLSDDPKSVSCPGCEKCILQENDIVFARTGNSTGRAFFYEPKYGELVYAGFLIKFHLDDTKVTPKYMKYYTISQTYRNWVNNGPTGSTRGNMSEGDFADMPVFLPSRKQQDAIVNLFSPFDEKIDNNNAIAAELEGMAKDLYDYWFVQFDFPDENGKPYKSSGGKMVWNDELKREIPEGWENGIVSDLGTVVTGGTPSTGCAEYFAKSKSGHAWATPKDLSNLNGRYFYHGEADITDAGLKNSAGNIMPKGSVLFTTRAPIGYIAITANEACTNQGFKSIIPAKKFGTEFVFQTLKMLTPQMQRVGVGSTFKEVSKDVFSHQSIVIPSVNLLKKYAALTLDIAEKIRNTQEENVELTSLRDFLLPMLMNGQVKVKGA